MFNQPGGDVFFKRRFSYRHHSHLPLGLNAPHTLEASELNREADPHVTRFDTLRFGLVGGAVVATQPNRC